MRDDKAVRIFFIAAKALFLGFMATAGVGLASTQSTEADVAARLKGKPLYLQGFWIGDKLTFQADGRPDKVYPTDSFTLSGFDFGNAKIQNGRLKISGERVGLIFDRNGHGQRHNLGGLVIEIAAPPDNNFTKALNAVFVDGLAELAPLLPSYWQAYAQTYFLPRPADETSTDSVRITKLLSSNRPNGDIRHVGGNIKPPRVIQSADPVFSSYARNMKLVGNVNVYMWVEPDGSPSHLQVVRPLGMGLDERALRAASQFQYSPATRDGEPIRVELYINMNMNFQMF